METTIWPCITRWGLLYGHEYIVVILWELFYGGSYDGVCCIVDHTVGFVLCWIIRMGLFYVGSYERVCCIVDHTVGFVV